MAKRLTESNDEMSFYEHFGRCLKAARGFHGINLTALAKKLGMSRTTLTEYEAGRQRVTLYNFCRLISTLPSLTYFMEAPFPVGSNEEKKV